MSASIQAAKKALRRAAMARLKMVSPAEISSDTAAVTARVLASPWYKNAVNISIYLSTSHSEIQTDSIIRHALSEGSTAPRKPRARLIHIYAGKSLFIPFCPLSDPTVMRMLRLRSLDHFEGLQPNRWGIREVNPAEADTLEDAEDEKHRGLDLILVPGLLFDKMGQRLGHGRGYYDRYLLAAEASYPSKFGKSAPFTAALALRAQVLPEREVVPTEEWDQRPNVIVTPDSNLSQ